MKHRRRSYVRIMMLYLIAILLLLFAWWASAEVYKPKPTPLPTDVIVLPPKATATDVHPVATNTAIPVTIATQTIPSTLISTATQAPTYTATHTYIPPTATPYYHVPNFVIIEHDCIIMSGNMRKSYMTFVYSCSPFILYNYVYDVALPYRIPRGTIIPPTIVPETPPPGVTPKP